MSLDAQALQGIWVPLVTPFRDEEIDLECLTRLIEWLLSRGVRGFLVLGTTGEAPHLADAEAQQVVECVVSAVRGRVPVMAGSGRPAVRETLRITQRFARAGVDAALVLTPFYYRTQLSSEAQRDYYVAVAEESPVPLFVYHIPQVTGVDLEADVLAEILAHPNVWGFKDSSSQASLLRDTLARRTAHAFVGSAPRVQESLAAGAAGAILAVAHVLPEASVALYDACRRKDTARAGQLQRLLADMAQALHGAQIAGIRCGLEVRGHAVGPPRRPLVAASQQARSSIESIVRRALEDVG